MACKAGRFLEDNPCYGNELFTGGREVEEAWLEKRCEELAFGRIYHESIIFGLQPSKVTVFSY